MPKIPPMLLNSVVYLYENKVDAINGENFGGTGFLIEFPSERFPDKHLHCYVVTNWHVAVKGGASVIRVNTLSGNADFFDHDPSEWIFNPKYDIAIIPINLDANLH